EPDSGLFICESSKVIRRALEAGYQALSILTSEKNIDKPDLDTEYIFDKCKDIPIYFGADAILRNLAGYALTGGIFAAMKRKNMPSMEKILDSDNIFNSNNVKNKKKVVAVLENIHNPTNMGAIFRSAAALGINAIIITDDSTDPLYRRAERVSMGTVFQIAWTRIGPKEDYIKILKEKGFSTVAMALSEDAVNIDDPEIKKEEKLAIVLGNEGYGLKSDTIDRCEYVAMIPMNPLVDSLNVAAASSVMFWELIH
ncbi:MAG: RNA methyltransferase, partial [Eubacterium sp.]|nr:RNA methyltransferase [Eubacterium sp.]